MNTPFVHPPGSPAPYGTEPRRAPGPLVALLALYGLWLAVLAWLAWRVMRGA
ncbi:MAG: hypothetical protein AB7Q17_11565 [Phycisphaerae bacterium]